MALGYIMVADVLTGGAAAWSAGVAWSRKTPTGMLARLAVGTTYFASVLCLTFPLLLAMIEMCVRDRALVRPGATVAVTALTVGTALLAMAVCLHCHVDGSWVWPSWSRRDLSHMKAAGGEHAGEVAAASVEIAGHTVATVSNATPGFELIFFPEFFNFEIAMEVELLVVGLVVAMCVLAFVPGVFAAGAVMALAMRRHRDRYA